MRSKRKGEEVVHGITSLKKSQEGKETGGLRRVAHLLSNMTDHTLTPLKQNKKPDVSSVKVTDSVAGSF